MNLFDDDELDLSATAATSPDNAPLAARLRPRNFDEFAGQKHLVGPGAPFVAGGMIMMIAFGFALKLGGAASSTKADTV